MKVAIISERWSARADEGMLNFLRHMATSLEKQHELSVIYARGEVPPEMIARRIRMGKGLVGPELRKHLAEFDPDLTCYVPTACATLNALYRNRRLERTTRRSKNVFISLQRRGYSLLGRGLLPFLRPERMIVLSDENRIYYESLGFEVDSISVGVDLDLFRPVDSGLRDSLRARHRLPTDRPVILHVGHLGRRRGLRLLEELAADAGFHVLFVASTATTADEVLRKRLQKAGIDLRHEYISQVQELYQASDAYVFPVENPRGSIEFPLSVLEAMACNLPVLTARFGGIAERFPEGRGVRYLDGSRDVADQVRELLAESCNTRSDVEGYGWDAVFDGLIMRLTAGGDS